jgi:hypothetical protein
MEILSEFDTKKQLFRKKSRKIISDTEKEYGETPPPPSNEPEL